MADNPQHQTNNAPLVNYEGERIPAWVLCPSGQKAYLDRSASYPAYRCSYCQSILGSISCGCTYDQEE